MGQEFLFPKFFSQPKRSTTTEVGPKKGGGIESEGLRGSGRSTCVGGPDFGPVGCYVVIWSFCCTGWLTLWFTLPNHLAQVATSAKEWVFWEGSEAQNLV